MKKSYAFKAALVLAAILLIGILYMAVTSMPPQAKSWEVKINGSVDRMFAGSDDTLCLFQGNNVTALNRDGDVAWHVEVPGNWRVIDGIQDSGYVYVCAYEHLPASMVIAAASSETLTFFSIRAKVMAISPQGTIVWEYPFVDNVSSWYLAGPVMPDDHYLVHDIAIQASHGRVYVFHGYREDVLGSEGQLLFSIDGISNLATADDAGNVYAIQAVHLDARVNGSWKIADWTGGLRTLADDPESDGEDVFRIAYDPTYMARTSIIDAYRPDGSLMWSTDLGEKITPAYGYRQDQYCGSMASYLNGTLYVPVRNGMAALGANGTLKWIRHLGENESYVPFDVLPVDMYGNVFMKEVNESEMATAVCMITPAGEVIRDVWTYPWHTHLSPATGGKDIIYAMKYDLGPLSYGSFDNASDPGAFAGDTLTAYDPRTGKAIWNFSIPSDDLHVIVLNESNVNAAIPGALPGSLASVDEMARKYREWSGERIEQDLMWNHMVTLCPGNDIVYMSYYNIIYESPVLFNSSRGAYVNSLYAIGGNGTLLWKKPLDGLVMKAASGNGTIYYSTLGGRIGGNVSGIATGIALVAVFYAFIRFIAIGTVTRARGRLDENANRNAILKFISDNPGTTALDIVRGLDMNSGTIRYHLFILAMNHKVVTHKEDDKYLRYFTNGGSYTEEERSMMSLIRRKPIGKVLALLDEHPGMSNTELSREMEVSSASTIRYMNELLDRGIVEKFPKDEKSYAYYIKKEHGELIRNMIKRV